MKHLLCTLSLLVFSNFSFGQKNTDFWKVSSPETQGASSAVLLSGLKDVEKEKLNMHRLLVIKNQHNILDVTFHPNQKEFVHDLASVTKSIVSLLTGIAIDKGFIKSDEDLVIKYFPEYANQDERLQTLIIKDLLNMASGWQCSWNDGEKELKQMMQSDDWAKFMFKLPFESKPGEKFSYCSGNFYLLAAIIQKSSKMSLHDFAKKYLFQPLGITESYWMKNDDGIQHGWGDLHLNIYDVAKIGQLIIGKGKWNGKQIISTAYVNKIKPLYPVNDNESYGYGFWFDNNFPGEIQAIGRGGQRLFVLPYQQTIIVCNAGGIDAGEIDDLVLMAVAAYDPAYNNSNSLSAYVAYVSQNVSDPVLGASLENIPESFLNRPFQFNGNPLQLQSMTIEKNNDFFFLVFDLGNGKVEKHPIGYPDYVYSKHRDLGLPIAVKGSWKDNQLTIHYNELTRINFILMTLTFKNKELIFQLKDITNGGELELKGNCE